MNDLQKKLLEIAKEYIRVCDQLGLKYFAVGGTCLGAVRHQGFIPWDDDMDFAMPRKDYTIFCKNAQRLFPKNYFIQTYHTDKNYLLPFAKIRDSNTTFIDNGFIKKKINQGCFIDIFPIDRIPSNKNNYKKFVKISSFYFYLYYSFYDIQQNDFGNKKILSNLFNVSRVFRFFVIRLREKYCSKFNDEEQNSELWWNCGPKPPFVLLDTWFGEGIKTFFESIPIVIPSDYKMCLSSQYGDWEKLPPMKDRRSCHYVFLDLDKPFATYYKVKYCITNH